MPNLTVRNISVAVFDKIKCLATAERRSLNSEILILLEEGLQSRIYKQDRVPTSLNKAIQLKLWNDLCGKWVDDRSADEVSREIIINRTPGRSVEL